jgi:hypothetical protein
MSNDAASCADRASGEFHWPRTSTSWFAPNAGRRFVSGICPFIGARSLLFHGSVIPQTMKRETLSPAEYIPAALLAGDTR